ncbi:hypothetical protein K458DRAFT_309076 [Lentithecium fluviatile CBS 122367]|uniref:Uncharacterized protein n=1 Tax=Lentithecium fluviatile CBS 122367 TaxID=1168545 RepID=A0A6G1IU49_9PLEO|nr:hypothetical protein K458DRAFT_309076 [Lentithecium fluviatile CBS 122367]
MPPGLLWVSSRIHLPPTLPPSVPRLIPSTFCFWYENTHIQEVTVLSGVPKAARYEAITEQPDAEGWSVEAPWLTVYEMPDIRFRESKEFKRLDGQSLPKKELLDGVFRQARFDTRFYEISTIVANYLVDAGPAAFLVSWSLSSLLSSTDLEGLEEIEGFRRVRVCKVVNATTLDQFERMGSAVQPYVVLIEFDGVELPVMSVKNALGRNGDGAELEVGWYRLKRVYE